MSENGEVLKISLGGREFTLKEFPWRLLKKYLPLVRAIPRINFAEFTEEDLDKIADVMFQAINVPDADNKDGAPVITRDDFEALPITLKQMMEAIPSLLKQAGVEPAKPGENQAESPSASTN